MEDCTTKVCTKCKIEYPLTRDYFVLDKRRLNGLGSWCRPCSRKAVLSSQRANPQKERDRQNEWAANHREIKRARSKEWDQKNPDKARLRRERFHANNPDYFKKWAKNNPEKIKESGRRWAHANAHKLIIKVQRREARKRALPHTLTINQWEDILAEFHYSCAYCGKAWYEIDGVLHQEHVIPLSQDGGYTKDNIVPACQTCNSKKSNRTPAQAGMSIINYADHS